MGFLTDLTDRIRQDLEARPLDASGLMARALARPPARGFEEPLGLRPPALIAEVKRASPSAGAIAPDADPARRAGAYAAGGAAAISVLTEPRHFNGSLTDLEAVRLAVELPVLRKDFLIDPTQIIEARAYGADAVLLIASCLGEDELTAMLAAAHDLGLGALVETHSDDDLDKAVAVEARVIGVNARDLETLDVDVAGALDRLRRVPAGHLAVLESGVRTRDDVAAAVDAGASAILVGEALMRADDPAAEIRRLRGEEPAP
jgi:indole-3-glycerol phosphate synthase